MSRTGIILVYAIAVPLILAVNYGLALLGEPRSAWLFQLLGLL